MGIRPIPWTPLLWGGGFVPGEGGQPVLRCPGRQVPSVSLLTGRFSAGPSSPSSSSPARSAIPGHFLRGLVPWVGRAAQRSAMPALK